jgi:dolichol kinase
LVSPFWFVWGRESKVLISLLHFSVGGGLGGITGGVPGGYYHRAKQNKSTNKKAENSKLAFGSVICLKKFDL